MALEGKRIFVVDDDPSVRESLGKALRVAGYEVLTAADAEEASARFVPGHIDLVLLDLNLPLTSGWDVFERLTTRHPTMPVIIITGLPHQYPTALAMGVGALVEKPFEVPVLVKTMEELLAEPAEAPLRRMCGFQQDTRYCRSPGVSSAPKPHPRVASLRWRQRTQRGREE